jgi:hypothetical protein
MRMTFPSQREGGQINTKTLQEEDYERVSKEYQNISNSEEETQCWKNKKTGLRNNRVLQRIIDYLLRVCILEPHLE